jgi:hypothetical protein
MGIKVVGRWRVELKGHVARINELINCHWRVKHALRQRDDQLVGLACNDARVPDAAGKRRVDLHVVLGPRQRVGDTDCPFWKSLLDALKASHRIVNDSPRWCEAGDVTYERGPAAATVITLTDLEGE